jgi:hypothetical protein
MSEADFTVFIFVLKMALVPFSDSRQAVIITVLRNFVCLAEQRPGY